MAVQAEHDFLLVRQPVDFPPDNRQPLHVNQSPFRRNSLLGGMAQVTLDRPGILQETPVTAFVVERDISRCDKEKRPGIADLVGMLQFGEPGEGGLGNILRIRRSRPEGLAQVLAQIAPIAPVQLLEPAIRSPRRRKRPGNRIIHDPPAPLLGCH